MRSTCHQLSFTPLSPMAPNQSTGQSLYITWRTMSFVKIWNQFYSLLPKKRTMWTFIFSQMTILRYSSSFLKESNSMFLIKAIYLMVRSGHRRLGSPLHFTKLLKWSKSFSRLHISEVLSSVAGEFLCYLGGRR